MRELKFRGWDLNEEEMIDGTRIYVQGDGHKWVAGDNKTMRRVYDEVALMQYTGLKDREGARIYEGDILSQYFCKFLPQQFGEKLEVEQGNIIGEVIYSRDRYMIDEKSTENSHKIMSDCVVIGNIYEDAELLKEDNDA